MGALDGFYSTWNKARATFGQGAPTDGSQFDQSRSLTQMKASVEAAAPDDRWQGSGANAYAAANKEHAQVYQKLADLDQKMAAEVKNAANVVSAGRTNLDNAKSWVEGMANSLPATSQQDRERKLIPIAREGINRVDNIVKSATADMMGIKGRVTGFKTEYDAIKNSIRFASGAKEGGLPDIFNPEEKKDEDKKKPELNSKNGKDDGAALRDPLTRAMLPSDYHDRLIEATTLSPEQLADLAEGKDVVVGADRMAYLYQLSQAFNGMSPEEIKAATAELPPDERKALAQGLSIVSNHHALSGIPNTEGVTDATRDTFIPAAGSLVNLPDGMHEELSRSDRVVVEPAHTVPTGSMFPAHIPERTHLNGVGAMQDVTDILKPADPAYLNGSEATKSMLNASSEYAAADAAHRATSGDSISGPTLSSDHHGPDLQGALAGVVQFAGNDHVGVHDLSTNPATRESFLHGMTAERWGENSSAVGDAFRWTGNDPHNPIASETANSVAHYLADNKHDLQHMPGGGFFGEVNGGLLQAMADGTAPYLAQLAGAGPGTGFTAAGIETFDKESDMSSLFSVFDQDHNAGTVANNAALQQKFYLEMTAAERGEVPGNSVEVASRLSDAMANGAVDAKEAGLANHVWQLQQDNERAGTAFDTVYGGLTALEGLVPGGQVPAAIQTIMGPMFKDQFLPEFDPTTVQGDSFFTDQLSENRFSNTTSNYAVALQGLLNAHPEIAHDPSIARFINGNTVDLYMVANSSANADEAFSDWFQHNGERYGYDAKTWTTQRQDGKFNDNWSY